MELDQLKTFLTVAEVGTFSRAAILLATTQPVLSRKIKLLEEELGNELFHRTGRGVVLSEGGKLLSSTPVESSIPRPTRRRPSKHWAPLRSAM